MSEQTMTRAAGPSSYGDERLLEIAVATRQIAFSVRLWSILTVVGVGLSVLFVVIGAVASASYSSVSGVASSSSGPSGVAVLVVGLALLVIVGVVVGLAYVSVRGPSQPNPATAELRQNGGPRPT
jgi:hypothetical protein